jgi:hypothetical protein
LAAIAASGVFASSRPHLQRLHHVSDEAVLIAAHEAIALRLRIGLDREPERLRGCAHVLTQIGLVEAQHHQRLERKERQEHVRVHVGDDARERDRRMRREVE